MAILPGGGKRTGYPQNSRFCRRPSFLCRQHSHRYTLFHIHGQIHTGVNCTIDVKRARGGKWSNAHARTAQLYITDSWCSRLCTWLRRSIYPLPVSENMEGRDILHDLERTPFCDRDARLFEILYVCLHGISAWTGSAPTRATGATRTGTG